MLKVSKTGISEPILNRPSIKTQVKRKIKKERKNSKSPPEGLLTLSAAALRSVTQQLYFNKHIHNHLIADITSNIPSTFGL